MPSTRIRDCRPVRPIDQAFAVLRDLYMQVEGPRDERFVTVNDVVKKCIGKGIDEEVAWGER